jgi:hypothetical protein
VKGERAAKVAILGSRSLSAYTDRILSRGFEEAGWQIVSPAQADFLLVQLHGAPHAADDDVSIVHLLPALNAQRANHGYGVLIHRPDEIQGRSELFADSGVLESASFIALLGTFHVADDWLVRTGVPVRAVPHGFFSSRPPVLRTPVVIGSHTRWGEMRRLDDAVTLLAEVLSRAEPGSVVGYLGGEGAEAFDLDLLTHRKSVGARFAAIEVVHNYGMVRGAAKKRVLVVNPGPIQPPDLTPILNVQLYHLNGRLRTGENSGSLHQYPSVPIVFEMNGGEVMEDLKVIRVPYANDENGVCGDFAVAADKILDWIRTDRLKKSLRHNQRRAEALGPKAVARYYQDLFESFDGARRHTPSER